MIQELLSQGGWVLVAIVAASVVAWSLLALAWMDALDESRIDWDAVDGAIARFAGAPGCDRPRDTRAADGLVRDLVARVSRSFPASNTLPGDPRLFRFQAAALLAGQASRHAAYLRPIAVLAAVMPLLGLLGTILGIMVSFEGLAAAPASRLDAMAGGISGALITTEAGLVATLPVVLAHGALGARLRRGRDAVALRVRRIEAALFAPEAA
ncbi:MAG: MotA/TolQ/ExbB proton channel family protein [Planctomycetota bacterium]